MGSPAILDIEGLVKPIPGALPAGPDLRADRKPTSPYPPLKAARTKAGDQERDRQQDPAAPAAKWGPILTGAKDLIQNHSKDLEATTWLIEALAREKGFPGLRDGFRLARELVERFWDGLHPMPDADDGWGRRIVRINGLNGDDRDGTLIDPINAIPLTQTGGFGRAQLLLSQQLEGLSPEARKSRIEAGYPAPEAVLSAASKSSTEFLLNMQEDIQAAGGEYDKLIEAIEQRLAALPPDQPKVAVWSSRVRQTIAECETALKLLAGDRLGRTDVQKDESGGELAEKQAAASVNGSIHSRQEAFQILERAADTLRQIDQHTPVIFLLDRANRWSRMSLPDVFSEMIEDGKQREAAFKLAGIPQVGGSSAPAPPPAPTVSPDVLARAQSALADAGQGIETLRTSLAQRLNVPADQLNSSIPEIARIGDAVRTCAAAMAELAPAAAPGSGSAPSGASTEVRSETKELRTREAAFHALESVSIFLKRHERHTPVIPLLDRAIRWGRMNLPEVLNEMIEDEPTREAAFKLAGIPLPVANDNEK